VTNRAAESESKQAEDAALKVVQRIQQDPVWFVEEILGETLWSRQKRILESVRDEPRTAVRSCHGVGKTFVASCVVPWWLAAWPREAVAVSTAPTWLQVREQLWREIAARCASSKIGFPRPNQASLTLGDTWYALGLSTDKPERFQGFHAGRLLLLVDEASGVSEAVYEAGEGFLTGEGARILLIGNPTQLAGQFHRAFHAERALWSTIHVSAFDSPNLTGEAVPLDVASRLVSREWVDEKRIKWGEASPLYQVRVLGDFPTSADNTVCPLGLVEAAQQRWPGAPPETATHPLVVSCDVARFGSDETVIAERVGDAARIVDATVGRDTMSTTGRILDAARRLAARLSAPASDVTIVVDDAGVGGGVTDRLREVSEFPVEAFTGAQAAVTIDPATKEPAYPNRRSEAWFAFAEQLGSMLLDPDEQLLADLVAPTYKLDSRGRRVVEPKDDTKKRLGRSPDRADAILMLFAPAGERGAGDGWVQAYADILDDLEGGIE
jgi:phage terminase large subunit